MDSSRQERRALQEQQRAAKAMKQLQAAGALTTFLIVRHGETSYNKEHRLQGQRDIPLNEQGLIQAQQLAESFKARQLAAQQQQGQQQGCTLQGAAGAFTIPLQPVTGIYSSDLCRATRTAQELAAALGLQVHTSKQLRERCLGVVQGLTSAEAKNQQPEAWQAVISGQESLSHGVEGRANLIQRVADEIDSIAAQHAGETEVVVCHGGCIAAMHLHATGRAYERPAKNGAVHVLAVGGGKWVVVDWSSQAWNNVSAALDGFGGGLEGG